MQPLQGRPRRGLSKQLLCLIWSEAPTRLVSAPLPCCVGGPRRPGAVGFISCSFVVSLIVRFNVLDQNLWICKAWGCTQTAWEIKTGIIFVRLPDSAGSCLQQGSPKGLFQVLEESQGLGGHLHAICIHLHKPSWALSLSRGDFQGLDSDCLSSEDSHP